MQAWSLALDKSYDVASTEARERHRSVAEPIGEKSADERHVVDSGRTSQRALVSQVALERLCLLLHRSQSAWCNLLSRDCSLAAQEVDELSQRSRVTLAPRHPARARSQVAERVLGGDATNTDGLFSEPSTEVSGEQNFPVSRTPPVSLLASPFCKRLNECRQQAIRRVGQHDVAIDDVLHDRLLLPVRRGN